MPVLRRTFVGLVFTIIAGIGALALAQRDRYASHPALAHLPPLIPVQEFYAQLGVEWAFQPSPDGKFVSFWKSTIGGNVLAVRDLTNGREIADFHQAEWAYWSPRAPRLRILYEGRLWEVDPLTPAQENWQDVSPRGINSWNLVTEAVTSSARNIVLSYDRSQLWPDLFTTDPAGRGLQPLAENDGTILYWVVDSEAVIKGRMVLASDGSNRFQRADGPDNFAEILTIGHEDDFQIIDTSASGGTFLALSNIGTDKIGLISLDAFSGAIAPIAEFDDVDVSLAYDLTPHDGQVDLIVGDSLTQEFQALTPNGKTLLHMMQSAGEPVDLNFLAVNGNGRYVTATLSPQAKSYVYRHFDLTEGKYSDLGTFAFREGYQDDLAPTSGALVRTRDGLQLPVYVTRPKGVSEPGPTIIEVHGGPEHHRRWEYSHQKQFLANRGYTVISVNYRGSNGWGRAFRDAGYGEFGAKIQEDIVDVAAWAVSEGLADPAAMAVLGDSFGGYSAVMALMRDDNPFKAGLAIVPMLDVEFQTRNAPAFWGLDPKGWTHYFGDYKDPDQAKVMKARSPVNLAYRLKTPLLVLAGRQDQVVNIEQIERFDEETKASDEQMQLHIFDNEGHGWDYWKTNVTEARLTEDFLAQYLGGRSGGWDWVEWAAEWID